MLEQRVDELLGDLRAGLRQTFQPPQQENRDEHQKVETALDRVRNAIGRQKQCRPPRRRDDAAVQVGDQFPIAALPQ